MALVVRLLDATRPHKLGGLTTSIPTGGQDTGRTNDDASHSGVFTPVQWNSVYNTRFDDPTYYTA